MNVESSTLFNQINGVRLTQALLSYVLIMKNSIGKFAHFPLIFVGFCYNFCTYFTNSSCAIPQKIEPVS